MNTIEIIKVLASWADGKGCGVIHYTEEKCKPEYWEQMFGSKVCPMLRTGQYLWSYTDLGVTATDVIKDDNNGEKIYLYRLMEELDKVYGKLLELEATNEVNLYTMVKVERIRQDIDIMRGVE